MIYVDPLRNYHWRLGNSCHMTTDGDLEELHLFAKKIGMKREWFQPSPPASVPHYDLTAKRREAAVAQGAEELTGKIEQVLHFKMLREKYAVNHA